MSQSSPDEITNIETVNKNVVKLRVLHDILDIAGARVDERYPTSSPVLDEPTAIHLLDAYDALTKPPEFFGLSPDIKLTADVRNVLYLRRRLMRLNPEALRNPTQESISHAYTEIILANMFLKNTPKEFAEIQEGYGGVPKILKNFFSVTTASRSFEMGIKQSLEYGPALLRALGEQYSMCNAIAYFIQLVMAGYNTTPLSLEEQVDSVKHLDFKHLVTAAQSGQFIRQARFERHEDTVVFFPSNQKDISLVDPVIELHHPNKYALPGEPGYSSKFN